MQYWHPRVYRGQDVGRRSHATQQRQPEKARAQTYQTPPARQKRMYAIELRLQCRMSIGDMGKRSFLMHQAGLLPPHIATNRGVDKYYGNHANYRYGLAPPGNFGRQQLACGMLRVSGILHYGLHKASFCATTWPSHAHAALGRNTTLPVNQVRSR